MAHFVLIEYDGSGYEIPVTEEHSVSENEALLQAVLPDDATITAGVAQ